MEVCFLHLMSRVVRMKPANTTRLAMTMKAELADELNLDEAVAKVIEFAREPVPSFTAPVPEEIVSLIQTYKGPLATCAYSSLTDDDSKKRLSYAQHLASMRRIEEQYQGTRAQKTWATFKWIYGLGGVPRHNPSASDEERYSIVFLTVMTLIPVSTLALVFLVGMSKHP